MLPDVHIQEQPGHSLGPLDTEDEGTTILLNIRNHLPNDKA